MTKVRNIIAAVISVFLISGCSNSEEPDPTPVVYNIVTYESTATDGSLSTFSYQVSGDSPLITLSAKWDVPDGVRSGMRLLLAYIPESHTIESGAVSIVSYAMIPGGEFKLAETVPESQRIRMVSMWRSGDYLNLHAEVTLSGQPSEISLYAESSTVDSSCPQAYIVIGEGDGELVEAAGRQLYASWNISELWSLPSLEEISVAYTDPSGELKSIEFTK